MLTRADMLAYGRAVWSEARLRHNAKVSGAGTASAGLPGYAGDNNGERK